MNATRRKEISLVLKRLYELVEDMSDLLGDIETIKDDENEALDNIPESLQVSDRYTQIESAANNLDEAYDVFSDIILM